MNRNKLTIALLLLLVAASTVFATGYSSTSTSIFAPETINYKVMFKWGLINKQAGHATLTLNHGSDGYITQLTAASEPWADRIYRVRDTLNGRMTYADFTPYFYEKIAHEGGENKHDIVAYDYSTPGVVKANCTRRVIKKGELKVDEKRQLEAESKATDMLSSFFLMRSLPYDEWEPGHIYNIDIFSGKRKELLSIKYHGLVNLDVEGTKHDTYYITFIFTSKGGKKTSDDMEAWIAADDTRLPWRLEGRLPVGKVHCIYTGNGNIYDKNSKK